MAKIQQSPIIDGGRAIFEWRGKSTPQIMGDFNSWDAEKAFRLAPAGKNRWRYSLPLPVDAYIEYIYLVDGERMLDPHNPRKCYNGISDYNNFFYMPGFAPTPLIKKSAAVPHGVLKRVKVQASYLFDDDDPGFPLFEREVYFYQPPVSEPAPLLVVFDGPDYLRQAKLPLMIDNLIHQKRIRPLALAMLANGGRQRFIEYACSDVTLGLLTFNLLPAARKALNLIDIKKAHGAFGVLGASMGGLMALYAGLRLPDIFGAVLSQSGAFYPKFVVRDLVQAGQARNLKIWMDVGRMENLHTFNQQMHNLLVEKGYDATYQEYSGGHNYTAWRDDLATGLEHLFS